jgi:hypothetical protein
MKPVAKQLIVAAFVLALVTVASLGIRQVRFSVHRARTVESPVIAEAEPDSLPAESDTVDPEPEPLYAEVPEPEEEVPSGDYAKAKPSRGDYAKAKSLQEISWGKNENLYITGDGETWYVGKGPDGKTTKFRVEIDKTTGEITAVEGAGKSGGAQKISMGGNDDVYITDEGETWYVTEGSKSRVEIDDSTGEITVLEQYEGDGGK